jgi:hypothetical protein
MSKTFDVSYMGFRVAVRIDDVLEAKMGLRMQRAPIEAIRFFYVATQGNYQELVVAYDQPDGRRGTLRIYGNGGDMQLKAVADALAALKPGIDLRGKPRREAFETMGVKDTQAVAMVVAPVFVMLLITVAMAPFIVHALDGGSEVVSAGELGKVKLSSRNLVLKGELDTERYLEVTNTKNGTKTSAEFQFPVFPSEAPDDAHVPVVLKTKEMSGTAVDALAERGEWKCTLRDVLWEGMASEDLAFMRDKLHLNASEATKLCELDDGTPDWFFLAAGYGSGIFLSAIIVLAVLRQRSRA